MKERILETADRLFYLQGIRAVGVDTIAAEIGISKRTLYNHFPSKDALISAYLGAPLRASRGHPTSRRSSRSSAPSIRWSGALSAKDFRGCPFVNAVAELGTEDRSVKKIAVAFKESRRLWFRDLLVQLGVADAEAPGDAARAAGRRLDRAGSGPQRSRDGTRGEGSRDGVAQECGGEGGRRRRYTHAEETPVLVGAP